MKRFSSLLILSAHDDEDELRWVGTGSGFLCHDVHSRALNQYDGIDDEMCFLLMIIIYIYIGQMAVVVA